MRAAWYERRGPARDVLVVGEMPDPEPGHGEVRIRVSHSGINPGDVKKRSGWQDSPMPYPRVVPHSDGAGVIDAVGKGVREARVGERAWCYGAQSYRPFGTAAEYVVVPDRLAVPLPASGLEEQAACLGIAGITGHRALFADGSVRGLNVLVHGATGGVGSVVTQLARRDGARVFASVRREDQLQQARALGAVNAFLTSDPELVRRIRAAAPEGVHRIAEVDFAAHIALDAQVLAVGGVISSYYSSRPQPTIPYWELGFADVTLRLLGSDDFPAQAKDQAAADLTDALVAKELCIDIAVRLPLEEIAHAHKLVEEGTAGRVLLTL
ncbi:NADPH:quinone reductase [Streptomyces sp. CA-106131]|uniref:NADPH:quinone reductase n=1 Tax=Streptomyces sp. CA-106131 TaxID=3240045 RepID=UPI003D8BAC5D